MLHIPFGEMTRTSCPISPSLPIVALSVVTTPLVWGSQASDAMQILKLHPPLDASSHGAPETDYLATAATAARRTVFRTVLSRIRSKPQYCSRQYHRFAEGWHGVCGRRRFRRSPPPAR